MLLKPEPVTKCLFVNQPAFITNHVKAKVGEILVLICGENKGDFSKLKR